MPGRGRPFTTDSGRTARRRRRGLNAWRHRIAKDLSDTDIAIQSQSIQLIAQEKPLRRALSADLNHAKICDCPFHVIAKYGYDMRAIADELERMRQERRTYIAQLRRELAHARTVRSLTETRG